MPPLISFSLRLIIAVITLDACAAFGCGHCHKLAARLILADAVRRFLLGCYAIAGLMAFAIGSRLPLFRRHDTPLIAIDISDAAAVTLAAALMSASWFSLPAITPYAIIGHCLRCQHYLLIFVINIAAEAAADTPCPPLPRWGCRWPAPRPAAAAAMILSAEADRPPHYAAVAPPRPRMIITSLILMSCCYVIIIYACHYYDNAYCHCHWSLQYAWLLARLSHITPLPAISLFFRIPFSFRLSLLLITPFAIDTGLPTQYQLNITLYWYFFAVTLATGWWQYFHYAMPRRFSYGTVIIIDYW